MFPEYIPLEANQLTEDTSIALAKQIQITPLQTSLTPEAINTAYVKQGSGGTPIILLHGFDSSLLEFRRLIPLLAAQQETWAVDLLGFGFSDRISQIPYGAEEIKTHLHYFWKSCIRQPVILVGASMGGAAAIDFSLSYPEAVEKLVLLDSAGLAKQPIVGKFMFPPLDYWATEFLRNPKVRQNISKAAYYDKTFNSLDAQTCAALHLKCSNWNQALIAFTKSGGYGSFAQEIRNITQETLILWGRKDQILGIKDAGKFAKLIPHNKLVWIENCGHVPHLEKAQLTAQEILSFC
ncbi:putative hydrolase or acyltransferase of alpha/beta superfamily [Hyella patelloides LEGE 07179]|uniref:Putative hydrolase or acyltransferase of alpha/beta superfamily n=1 Tax=Hyella patelloides LEGE 07179 TaxID=945734 RepID=A0A563VQB1_9CYAN|nr:alpha/beta hydrolase [Hyella patelloides]VEP13555.1 putative hydrolase or acyltransferase of alpha/beta superfamily [Hyella patelloides LEGE 07179]